MFRLRKKQKEQVGIFFDEQCVELLPIFSLFVKQLETGNGSEKGGGLEGENAKEMYLAHPENTALPQIKQY